MSKIIITKAKILKGDKVEIDYNQINSQDATPAEISDKRKDKPHKDLRDAFNKLIIHAVLIAEFMPKSNVIAEDFENYKKLYEKYFPILKDYNVSGFSIVGDNEGVIITAQRTLTSGKVMGFNTPIERFEDEGEYAYQFIDHLIEVIDTCKDELREYLNGKVSEEIKPPELPFAEPVTNMQVVEDLTKQDDSEIPSFNDTPVITLPVAEKKEAIKKTRGPKKPQTPENPSGE